MKITFVYCSLFLLVFGILLFARPVSAEETDIKVPTLAEGLDRKELSSWIEEDKKGDRSKWLSWFKGENLAVRGSFFGGKIRSDKGTYLDADSGAVTQFDRFRFEGRSNWGGEFGIGYKVLYGIELGISYMLMEINDFKGSQTLVDPTLNPIDFHNKISMDIDSRAIMFNVRTYLDDLTGIEMGRFSPYFLGSAGRATHKVTDAMARDYALLNPALVSDQRYDFSTSDNNKGEFAYRVGLGTLFRLTDHVSVDAHASFMDWGEARRSRRYHGYTTAGITIEQKPAEPDVRTTQGSIGIQFNF